MLLVELCSPIKTGIILVNGEEFEVFNHEFIKVSPNTYTPLAGLFSGKFPYITKRRVVKIELNTNNHVVKIEDFKGNVIHEHLLFERKEFGEILPTPLANDDTLFYLLYHYTESDDVLLQYFSKDEINKRIITMKTDLLPTLKGEVFKRKSQTL